MCIGLNGVLISMSIRLSAFEGHGPVGTFREKSISFIIFSIITYNSLNNINLLVEKYILVPAAK